MTEKSQDKPKEKPKEKSEIPMPVPSYGADKPKPKKSTKRQDKIDHNSDQPVPPELPVESRATPPQAGQIDAGESPTMSPSFETPVSPSSSAGEDTDKAPALPFDKNDLMSKQAAESNVPATRNLSPPVVSNGLTDMELDRQISDKKTKNWLTNQGTGYNVQGKYRPDAASIQGAANKNVVSSEILKAIQTKEYAEVTVRTYHVSGQYVDTIVHHDFENNRKMLLLEMAAKNPDSVSDFTEIGMPVFIPGATFVDGSGKKKNLMYTIMHSLLASINFSLRDATTKAASAGQAKILNREWRSEEEVESEVRERELVETLIKSRK